MSRRNVSQQKRSPSDTLKSASLRRAPASFAIILILLIVPVKKSVGNQIGLYASKMWIDNQNLENPSGGGIFFSRHLRGRLSTRIEVSHHTYKTTYMGRIYSSGPAQMLADPEPIRSVAFINSLNFSLNLYLLEVRKWVVSVGGGIGRSALDGVIRGLDSGRELELQSVIKISLSYSVGTEVRISDRLPILFTTQIRYILFNPSVIITDAPNPFGDSLKGSELRLGLAYMF